jgi:hypothetical protein
MTLNHFIFSDTRTDRIKRHFVFWGVWWIYFGLLHAANPLGKPEINYFKKVPFAIAESILLLVPQVILTYTLLYFVLEKMALKKKYLLSIITGFAIWSVCGVLNWIMVSKINPYILHGILPAKYLVNTQRSPASTFYMALLANYKGALTVAGIACCIKFCKEWYLKGLRNSQLQKENTEAQLQLLTAQVHPHFLFNTLNNIYSQTQTESPKGSAMIMGLSDLLRYILYEGNKPLVPLKQELLMIHEYINLEKIRYGNKLDVHVLIPDKTDQIYIAPLLLLPFIENCFKHGTSKILINPWINLTVEMKNNLLIMKLMNGKAHTPVSATTKSGIGIANVRQRLELLYKDKYDLQIREEEEVYVVDLRVELMRAITDELPGLNKELKLSYA